MDFVNFAAFILNESPSNLEKKFTQFYGRTISTCFDFNEKLMFEVKYLLSKKQLFEIHSYLHPESYQLFYMLRFAVHDTCVAVQKFYESVKDRIEIVEDLSKKNRIVLCCLESESIFAAIGICKVIDEAASQFGFLDNFDSYEIKLFVIDERGHWSRACECIVDTANSCFKKVELKLRFFECFYIDFVLDIVTEADVMVMARCLSKLGNVKKSPPHFLKAILKAMKKNGICFHLEVSDGTFHERLTNMVSEIDLFLEIGCTNVQEASFGNINSEQYNLDFPFTWETSFLPVLSSTWVKYREFSEATKSPKILRNENCLPPKSQKEIEATNQAKKSNKTGNQVVKSTVTVPQTVECKKSINVLDLPPTQKTTSKTEKKNKKPSNESVISSDIEPSSETASGTKNQLKSSRKSVSSNDPSSTTNVTGSEVEEQGKSNKSGNQNALPTSKAKPAKAKKKGVASSVTQNICDGKTEEQIKRPEMSRSGKKPAPTTKPVASKKKNKDTSTKMTAHEMARKSQAPKKYDDAMPGQTAKPKHYTPPKPEMARKSQAPKKHADAMPGQTAKPKHYTPPKSKKAEGVRLDKTCLYSGVNVCVVGKPAHKKKYDRHRERAKIISVARHANFDNDD